MLDLWLHCTKLLQGGSSAAYSHIATERLKAARQPSRSPPPAAGVRAAATPSASSTAHDQGLQLPVTVLSLPPWGLQA